MQQLSQDMITGKSGNLYICKRGKDWTSKSDYKKRKSLRGPEVHVSDKILRSIQR